MSHYCEKELPFLLFMDFCPSYVLNKHIEDLLSFKLINKSASGRNSRQKSASSTGKGRTGDVSMDSHSLIGQTMKVQDWLNEKTVKGLQVNIFGLFLLESLVL